METIQIRVIDIFSVSFFILILTLLIFINIYYFIYVILRYDIHAIIRIEMEGRMGVKTFQTARENQKNKQVFIDALNCLHLNSSRFPNYEEITIEERRNHTRMINEEIAKLYPSNNLTQHCWLGYCGPWIEDLWIDMQNNPQEDFGPFIPLFVYWVRVWIHDDTHQKYFTFFDKVRELLSPKYLYITVNGNDDGIEGRSLDRNIVPDNLLIISPDGRGHIPTLLFLREYNPRDFNISTDYQYDAMFLGSYSHRIRIQMVGTFRSQLGSKFYYRNNIKWQTEYEKAKFILCPRGYGRNSFRFAEVLQTGRVPVFFYNDVKWVPYDGFLNWSSFSIIANISDMNSVIDQIKNTSPEQIVEMRKTIHSLYEEYFTSNATMRHIKAFLTGGFLKSPLRCAKLTHSNC